MQVCNTHNKIKHINTINEAGSYEMKINDLCDKGKYLVMKKLAPAFVTPSRVT